MPFRSFPRKKTTSSSSPSGGLFDSAVPEGGITAHIDGGARGNPGPAGYGVFITDASGKMVAELAEYLGHKTNNIAEYSALIAALKYATEHGYKALNVVSDSELLVKQMNGEYKVRNPELQQLHEQARPMIRKLEHFKIRHVLRAQNKDADRLANEAMDRGSGKASSGSATGPSGPKLRECAGIVENGVVEFEGEPLPNGTRVKITPIR